MEQVQRSVLFCRLESTLDKPGPFVVVSPIDTTNASLSYVCINYNISSVGAGLNVKLESDGRVAVSRDLTQVMTSVLKPICLRIPSTNSTVQLYISAKGYFTSPTADEWAYFSDVYLRTNNEEDRYGGLIIIISFVYSP